MKHPEWLGDKERIEKLLRRTGLMHGKGEQIKTMKLIIKYRYIDMMSLVETYTALAYNDNIVLSNCAYYKAFNKAVKMMEKYDKKIVKKK